MGRRYVTATLTARVSGDFVVLLDVHGKKIATIPAKSAVCASALTIESIEVRHKWQNSFKQMLAYNSYRHSHSRQDEWQKKIQTWLKSVKCRRNRPEYCRLASERRAKRWSDKRANWEATMCLMLRRNCAVIHKHKERSRNPWRIWTETVAANIKARRNRHEDDRETIEADTVRFAGQTGVAGVQVRFDWFAADTANGVAGPH